MKDKPLLRETIDSLKLFKKQMNRVKKIINKIKNKISKQELDDISLLKDMLDKAGAKQRALMAALTVGSFRTLHQTYNYLELLNQNNLFISLESSLEQLICGIQAVDENPPIPKRGRKPVNLEKGIIHKLLHIYTNGTSKRATCNCDRTTNEFYGEFYDFMMNALVLLGKKIKVMEKNTWGDYAREVIADHYIDTE